ncbi:MAG: Ig-like domain-containing protein [Methanobrevibacter smithii]
MNTSISVIIENKTDSVIIKIIVPSDATGNVTVTVNGKNYTSEIVNGTAVITINGLSEGSYNVTVVYDGDDKYLANSTNSSFIIQINHDNEDGNGTDVNNASKLNNNVNTSNINANKQNNLNLNNTGNPLFMLLMALIIMLIPLRKHK